jgi:hypothetical protein
MLRLGSKSFRQKATGLAVALALFSGCADGDPDLRLPASLAAPDTAVGLRQNAAARDGCAFAGTWEYSDLPDGSVYSRTRGWIVFEVMGDRLRGADIEIHEDLLTTDIPSNFVIIDAGVAPGGRRASGRWEVVSRLDGKKLSGTWQVTLSEDGLSYQLFGSGYGGLLGREGRKVRSGPCNEPVPIVQDAFDSVRAGRPLSPNYYR